MIVPSVIKMKLKNTIEDCADEAKKGFVNQSLKDHLYLKCSSLFFLEFLAPMIAHIRPAIQTIEDGKDGEIH